MGRPHTKGACLVIFSAFLFGATPILGKLTYSQGSNGATLLFLRSALALPVLFLILRRRRIPLKLDRHRALLVLLVSSLGSYACTLLLYSSYHYLSVGLSTTLHFIYPIVTLLSSRILFRERLGWTKAAAAIASFAGIFLSAGTASGFLLQGVVMALLSGVAYAFYILMLGHTRLKTLHYMTLTFYQCVCSTLLAALINGPRGELCFSLTGSGYFLSLLVSLLVSVVAIPAFQAGVALSGGVAASLLSTFEPITSILCGILLLEERLTLPKGLGCLCILAGIVMTALPEGSVGVTNIKKE